MKLTVLVDNVTLTHLSGEWGLSIFIEAESERILFDVGASNLFITNAEKMGIDLLKLNYVVLSHGHHDHTWGLEHLNRLYLKAGVEKNAAPSLVAHPLAMQPKLDNQLRDFGLIASRSVMQRLFKEMHLSNEPVWLTERLVFLGEIERKNSFEGKRAMGKILTAEGSKDDYLLDDTGLAYKTDKGLVIIVGCSHSGICNIVEYAKKICDDERILDILGGLHLLKPTKEQLSGTVEYLKNLQPVAMRAGHCTDLSSKLALAKVVNLQEFGVGLKLEYCDSSK